MRQPLDPTTLNFIWLTDFFAFGLVSLTVSRIAALCDNRMIASLAAITSLLTLGCAFLLLSVVNYASILLASMIFILVNDKFHRAVKRSRMVGLAEKAA